MLKVVLRKCRWLMILPCSFVVSFGVGEVVRAHSNISHDRNLGREKAFSQKRIAEISVWYIQDGVVGTVRRVKNHRIFYWDIVGDLRYLFPSSDVRMKARERHMTEIRRIEWLENERVSEWVSQTNKRLGMKWSQIIDPISGFQILSVMAWLTCSEIISRYREI